VDTNLSASSASFWGENLGDESGLSVACAGDVNDDGYDDILIGARRNDENGSDAGQTYLLFYDDGSPPRIVSDTTPVNATTGEMITFNLSVSDNRGIYNVSIEYWYGDSGPHTNAHAIQFSGDQMEGNWSYTIAIPMNSTDTLHYDVHVWDRAFHLTSSDVRDIDVRDNDPPVLVDDSTPSLAMTGDRLTFSIGATDNIAIANVSVEYWYGDTGSHTNTSMIHVSGERWNLTITVPSDSLDSLHYLFFAEDNATNNATTSTMVIEVMDDDPPILGADGTPATGTTGDAFTFSVETWDNVGVEHVRVIYRYGDGQTVYVDLDPSGGDLWEVLVVIDDTLKDMRYEIAVIDTSGNINTTLERTVDIVDNDRPALGEDGTSDEGTTGDAFTFSIKARDNVGVGTVWAEYRYGEGQTTNVSMNFAGNDRWEVVIVVDDTLNGIRYFFGVLDSSGNFNLTSERTVEVVDNDGPEMVDDGTPGTFTTGDPFSFCVTVRDNIGLRGVMVRYVFGGDEDHILPLKVEETWEGGNVLYTATIDAPSNSLDALEYSFEVEDLSGNVLAGTDRKVSARDNDHPIIVYGDTVGEATKGLSVVMKVDAEDNIGIENVFIVYRYGDQVSANLSMEPDNGFTVEMAVPRSPGGDLRFNFKARDAAGNWASTGEYTILLVNLAPTVGEMPTWTVTEGVDAELDLMLYVNDVNDAVIDLTVECSDGSLVVEDLVLKARYDEAVPDWTVTLTVSDGEDSTEAELTIQIVNVNDVPVINSISPADGIRFETGETIVLKVNASDEDGDELTVTWMEGDKVLGTSSPFKLSGLSEGEHAITVVVDDGTDSTEDTITVLVEDEGIIRAMGYVVVFIIVLLAAVIMYSRER
jgi:hypothetical protein